MSDVHVFIAGPGILTEPWVPLVCAAALFGLAVTLRGRRRPDLPRDVGTAGLDPEERWHEVRSSLAGVAAAVEALAGLNSDIQGSPLVGMLREEVVRLKRLAGEHREEVMAPEPAKVSVDDLVGRVVLARRLIGQDVAWRPSGQHVIAQPDQVVEVLNTLLHNVSCHAAGAPARVDVASQAGCVTMTVSDSGPGVPDHLRRIIFARGARGDASPGEGLGLHIASNLVRAMGGTLSLRDTHGEGSAFTVELPGVVSARGGPTVLAGEASVVWAGRDLAVSARDERQ